MGGIILTKRCVCWCLIIFTFIPGISLYKTRFLSEHANKVNRNPAKSEERANAFLSPRMLVFCIGLLLSHSLGRLRVGWLLLLHSSPPSHDREIDR